MKATVRMMLALVLVLGGCASGASGTQRALSKQADHAAIQNLEVIFHRAASTKNVDEMMGLFADDAVFTIGGQTYAGKDQIRKFVENSASYKPENHWVSSTPAYKIRLSSDGDRGTLYFECDYIDVDSRTVKAVVGADVKVARSKDHWVFTKVVGGPAVLG